MFAISVSGRYGNISELTNRTLLTDSPIMVNFNDKIFTKIIKYFEFHYLWRLNGIMRMTSNDNKIMRRRLANAYLSSVISISLVLLLVGVASLLLVNAKGVSDYFKEKVWIFFPRSSDESFQGAVRVHTGGLSEEKQACTNDGT